MWTEWNGNYRDTVRDLWRGEHATLPEFAYRFTGSSDLYADDGRHPFASVNFVTCHDGFTLADLVSYNAKHNEANGEGGRDGSDDNRSWNCGTEGPTEDPAILALRERQQRNFLATLLLSQGVPMLAAGDETGPHPAGQQQRLLPGQRDLLGALAHGRDRGGRGPGAAGAHPAADPAAPRPPGVPAPPLPAGQAGARGGRPARRRRVVHLGRRGDDRAGLGGGLRPSLTVFLNGGMYGIALSSERSGDAKAASAEYAEFVTAWKDADAALPQLGHARAFLTEHGGREAAAK